MLKICCENVRKTVPLVHNITNYVTVNDVANVLLACGGSPIMSDEPEDVTDITSICSALNINIGTLHKTSIEAMLKAGKKSNELGHPVLLDPVGAGASALRTNTAVKLMKELKLTVIRGNISEIKTLARGVSGSFFVFLFFFCGSLRIFCHNSLDYHMLFYVQHMDMKRSAAAEKAFAISWDPAGETADETVEGFRAVMRQFHLKFFLHFFQ